MAPNMIPSEISVILVANVTNIEGEEDGTVQSTMRGRREELKVLFVSLELKLRRVREKSASLATAVSVYNVQLTTLVKKLNEAEVIEVALMQELNMLREDVERQEFESMLVQHTTEGALDSTVRQADTYSRYVKQLLEVLQLH